MKTVLIADDEGSLRTLIETALEAPGLPVLHAADGNQGVELAQREHPDLILLDWKDRQLGFVLGIRAYLVKPFSPLQLLECVQRVLASQQRDHVHEPLQRVDTGFETPQTTSDLCLQLELYARDLKRVLAEEEERTGQLEMANRQLQAYAQDLKSALLAEASSRGSWSAPTTTPFCGCSTFRPPVAGRLSRDSPCLRGHLCPARRGSRHVPRKCNQACLPELKALQHGWGSGTP
jgi:CheY-like chemotaxis protein